MLHKTLLTVVKILLKFLGFEQQHCKTPVDCNFNMKRNYQSRAQKRKANRRKIAEAAKNSQRLSSWLTRPETSKADEQDVSISETENSTTAKDRSDASKNDDFLTTIVNLEIKKAIIVVGHKQSKGRFYKDPLQSDRSFSTN